MSVAEYKKYIIISPVRNEEKYIEKTIQSVIAQSVLPAQWIIVNDGSTDRTAEVIKEYSSEFGWIKTIDLPDRGYRFPGKGIIEVFYAGFEHIEIMDWHYLVKLDCDLSFDSNYFDNVLLEFEKNPRLGIASGKTYLPINGDIDNLRLERCPDNSTRGPSKIYKRECFNEIGGIRRERGWDALDDIAAMVKGYEVKSFTQYKVIHYRPVAAATNEHKGLRSRITVGMNCYYLGYHPLFMLLKSMKSMAFDSPLFFGGLAMFFGYVFSYVRRSPRIEEKFLIKQLQKIQLERIFGGERCV